MSTKTPSHFGTQEMRAQDIESLMNETRNFGQMGKFRIRGILGRGGCGIVYRAVDPDGMDVALKVITVEDGLSEAELERFIREAKSLAQLRNHPNIVHVHEAGRDGNNYFIAMDNIGNGQNVTRLIEEGGPLEKDRALDMAIQLAEALEHIHNLGFVHRDIKPSNILIDDGDTPVLTDFGLVQIFNSNLTLDGSILGTPGYLAPEVLEKGSQHTHVTTDMYSFGMVLYKMLTGHLPYDVEGEVPLGVILDTLHTQKPQDPSVYGVDLPKDLIAILIKLIERDPEDRYQLMGEVVEDLRSCRYGKKVKARIPTLPVHIDRWVRNNRLTAMLIASALIGILGIVLIVVSEYKARQQEAVLNRIHEVSGGFDEQLDPSVEKWKACLALMKSPDMGEAEAELRKLLDWAVAKGDASTATRARAALARIALYRKNYDSAREAFVELAAEAPERSFDADLYTFEAGVCLWLKGNHVAARSKWKAIFDHRPVDEDSSYIPQVSRFLLGKIDEELLLHAMDSASETFKSLGFWAMAQQKDTVLAKRECLKKAVAHGGRFFIWTRMEEK